MGKNIIYRYRGKFFSWNFFLLHYIPMCKGREKPIQKAQYCVALVRTPSQRNGRRTLQRARLMLGFLFTLFYFITNMKMVETKEREITFEDVVTFIIHHSDEIKRMDKINQLTYPFTSKAIMKNRPVRRDEETVLSLNEDKDGNIG